MDLGHSLRRYAVVLSLSCLSATTWLWAHPDHFDRSVLFHFALGLHGLEADSWTDATHHVKAKIVGKPRTADIGPARAIVFDGQTQQIFVPKTEATSALPEREFSVSAWVIVNKPERWGGICGIIQDDGSREAGWLLGYTNEKFSLAVATEGGDDGDGRLTYLPAQSDIEFGKWYFVAGTYDGQVMRLYVNGKLEAESRDQNGKLLYPEDGKLVLGGYVDGNEQHLLNGAILEVKAYNRVLSDEEIGVIVKKGANLVAYNPETDAELDFAVKPYLQFATQNQITIMCETNRPSKMSVEFAKIQPLTEKREAAEESTISTITLENLEQHTTYYYRVTCTDSNQQQVVSDIYSFQTAPPAHMPWAFAIIGDTQRNPEVTRKCADGAFSQRPHFLLHCGDVVDNGHAKNQWLQDFFEPSSRLLAHVPVFPVIGNHEKNSHWYYDYFHLPDPEFYYTFHYGNAQFFMIDTNKPVGPGTPQYKWLEEQLKASTATWKFTCHHHPCWSSDENDYGDRTVGKGIGFTWGDPNAKQLIALYEKYGVDIAFNGHIHVYERTWPIFEMMINQKKGVRYITSGGGGGGLETPAPQKSWFSLQVKRAHHYCYAAIHDRTMEFRAYDINEQLFDTFQLIKADDR